MFPTSTPLTSSPVSNMTDVFCQRVTLAKIITQPCNYIANCITPYFIHFCTRELRDMHVLLQKNIYLSIGDETLYRLPLHRLIILYASDILINNGV